MYIISLSDLWLELPLINKMAPRDFPSCALNALKETDHTGVLQHHYQCNHCMWTIDYCSIDTQQFGPISSMH
jgi:hypothetical protein